MFDSSAIFKRYTQEAGREQVLGVFERADRICVAPHLRLEVMTSANRLMRDRLIDAQGYAWLRQQLSDDVAQWEVMPLSTEVEQASMAALELVHVRAMDALHVGAAKVAQADLFVTADKRQAAAAMAMGLNTELVTVN